MKARKAPRRRKRAARAKPVNVAGLIRSVAADLKRAKLVFAHGTTDPAVEAAFIVAETLGIHPDFIESRATMPVTAARQKKIAKLAERRIRTRKPAAYLLKRIYMLGVPFYIDERAIVPRSFLGEVLASELFAGQDFSLLLDDDAIVLACEAAVEAGADFVKTSTGFSTAGATVEHVALMRRTVGERIGVKASGGVRTRADALAMIEAGATRIGASSALAILGSD